MHGWNLPPVFGYAPVLDPDVEREVGRSVTQMLEDTLLPWRNKFPDVQIHPQTVVGPGHRLRRGSGRWTLETAPDPTRGRRAA